MDLLEGAYFRLLFNYYIFKVKKDEGVMIPTYAMIHIEPNSNYKP